ncbi:F-box At5g07610-like [Olea europaea subsp. europaea]|uniref:F-box At5g07610-like n=1 Tax=Olea europaea subsp. europaea TaxID=158383 RepID=A0A8S0V9C4_OLEEU|nr:F-box At5g07610-like [Olea europaea subsp. europaea]
MASATVIAGNDQMLIEILLRLPIKSLIKFKSVSKNWHVLISSPYFSQLHTLRHQLHLPNTPPYLLLRASPSRFFYFNPEVNTFLPYDFPFSSPKLLRSCNGLLLLKCSSPETAVEDYLIYNPITRQSRKIVLYSDEKNAGTTVLGLSLAFDPSESPYYKVVCLRTTEYSMYSYQIEVYDSQTCTWNRWGDFMLPYDTKFCNGVYWKNCIHWIRPTGELFHFNLQYGTLEKRTGALPGSIRAYVAGSETFLRESNGHLHMMLLLSEAKFLSVWEMRMDKHGWFLKYSVDLNTIPATFAVISGQAVSVLDIIRGECENDSTLVFHFSGKIMGYWFYTKSFDVFVDLRTDEFYQPGSLQFGCSDAYQFIETLAPV